MWPVGVRRLHTSCGDEGFAASQTDGESYIDTRTADSDSATIINAAALAFLMAFAVIVLAGEDTSELNDPRLQAEGF